MRVLVALSLCLITSGVASSSYTLLNQQTGSVATSEYAYFSLNHQMSQPVAVVLKSLQGDCDLYLSQQITTKRPTFKKYDLGSTTCGIEHVITTPSLRYPLFIGIFGYPAGQDCEFQVDIIQLEMEIESWDSDTATEFDMESYVRENLEATTEESPEVHVVWEILKFILQVVEVLL